MDAHSEETTPFVTREDSAGIATLTLNRPQHYNALSSAMLAALQAEIVKLAQEEAIRVVILAARGKAFCAGHDLKEIRTHRQETFYHTLFDTCSQVMLALTQLPQPVIAKVQGIATAAGCQLVATCDLAVAANTARFATSGINVGLFCSTPGVALSRVVPRKQALELLLTGEFIDAPTALQQGLVNRVVPIEQLDDTVQQLADTIANKSAVAIKLGKQLFYEQLTMEMPESYRRATQVIVKNLMSDDVVEGIDAFLQKRSPQWKHR